jgi:hypothetical protein
MPTATSSSVATAWGAATGASFTGVTSMSTTAVWVPPLPSSAMNVKLSGPK